MRILNLTSLYHPEQVGGAELMVAQLAATLVGQGHEVGVACVSRREEPPAELDGVSVFRIGHGTPFHVLDWPDRSRLERVRYKLAVQWDGRTLARMARVVEAYRPDIVNTHSMSELTPRLWPMVARMGIPVVHTVHDFTSLCTNGAMMRDGRACRRQHLKCRVYALPQRACQTSVDAVAGVGREILERHLAAGFFTGIAPDLRRVIWNPIALSDAPRAPRPPSPGTVVFGYLGRIEPSKGADILIEACRALPPTGWRLLVAGRAVDGLDRYVAAAAGLPVEFVGFAERDAFLDRIDCLVVPPIWPEAFGRTVAEAYGRGVPVVGTRIGGIAEQIGLDAEGWLVPPGDARALAGAMARLVADPARLPDGLRNAATVLAGVQCSQVASRYLDLYRDVIDRRAPARTRPRAAATYHVER